MIEALTTGELIADPQQRTTRTGRPFWTATLRVPAGAESLLIGVAVFSESAGARLAQMRKGARIAAAGTLEPTTWMAKDGSERHGWRLTASELLSVHQARKRRETETAPRDDGHDASRDRTPPRGSPDWLDA